MFKYLGNSNHIFPKLSMQPNWWGWNIFLTGVYQQQSFSVYTTWLIRLKQLLKACVSSSVVECPYNEIDELDKLIFQRYESASVMVLGKCPNQKTHASESAGFLVWALPEVQNCLWKQFLHKFLYTYYSKNFWSVLSK